MKPCVIFHSPFFPQSPLRLRGMPSLTWMRRVCSWSGPPRRRQVVGRMWLTASCAKRSSLTWASTSRAAATSATCPSAQAWETLRSWWWICWPTPTTPLRWRQWMECLNWLNPCASMFPSTSQPTRQVSAPAQVFSRCSSFSPFHLTCFQV